MIINQIVVLKIKYRHKKGKYTCVLDIDKNSMNGVTTLTKAEVKKLFENSYEVEK